MLHSGLCRGTYEVFCNKFSPSSLFKAYTGNVTNPFLADPNLTKCRTPTAAQSIHHLVVMYYFAELHSEGSHKELIEHLSLLRFSCYQFIFLAYQQGYNFFHLSLLTSILTLVILCVPCQAQFHLCLGFTYPVTTHPNHIPVLSPSHLSLFHWLCIFFFLVNLRSMFLLNRAVFWPALQDFLHIMMASSCALRKVALKCCQHFRKDSFSRDLIH